MAMIETKKTLVVECKEEKAERLNEIKSLEGEKWRSKLVAKERKLKAEECRFALKEEWLVKDKRDEEHAIMFINQTTMVDTIKRYPPPPASPSFGDSGGETLALPLAPPPAPSHRTIA